MGYLVLYYRHRPEDTSLPLNEHKQIKNTSQPIHGLV